jgi:putative ABC transport system permease protein
MALLSNLKTSARTLARRPGFSLAIILTLTLAIGATSAIFSVIDAVLLKPLPYPASDRLVMLYESNPTKRLPKQGVAPVRVEEWNRLNHSFTGITAAFTENLTDTSAALPEKMNCARVLPRFFSVLETPLLLGRGFTPQEDLFGGPAAAVISEALWRRRFNADPGVLGKTLRLGVYSYPIVGIAPESFAYPQSEIDVWTPAQLNQYVMRAREARWAITVGRLRDDATLASAQADLSAVQARLAMQFPATDKHWSPLIRPLKEESVGRARRPLWLLFGAVTLVLLIASSNVACLMLVRASQRARDIAVRFSLGAPRARLVREHLLEAFCLAIPGGLCGLLLSVWGAAFFRQSAAKLPRAAEIHLDWRMVAFTFAVTVLTTILFGLFPALAATRAAIAGTLAHGSRTQVGGNRFVQQLLAGAQVALAIVLLIGAGLLIRSLASLIHMPLGFQPDRVLALHITAGWGETANIPRTARRMERTLAALRDVPGVEAAAITVALPGLYDEYTQQFHIAGRESDREGERLFSDMQVVSPDFFQVLGVPLVAGQSCRVDLDSKAPQPAIVSRQFAGRFFPNENPIGRRLTFGNGNPLEIAGIAADIRMHGYAKDPRPILYWCGLPGFYPDPEYLVKTAGDPMDVVNGVRRAVQAIEPNRAVYKLRTLPEALSESLAERRFQASLFALFAALALLLAAVGIYGVISFFVSQRTREIGLRVALGARPAQILAEVFCRGGAITIAGIAAGLAGAALLSRFLSTLLFGISVTDLVTFTAAPAAIAVVAAVAIWGPARRATRVDPMNALRQE